MHGVKIIRDWRSQNMIKQALIDVLGYYIPQAESGIASIDFEWIGACAALLLTLYCIWRIVGSVINRV